MGVRQLYEATLQERGLVISMRDTLLFRAGKADLGDDAKKVVTALMQVLSTIPNAIRIEGHTDSIPIHTPQFFSNWELSTARATNVLQYLSVNNHIEPHRLSAAGYGEYKPVVDNSTEYNRAINRRVDIVVLSDEFTKFEPGQSDTVSQSTQDAKAESENEASIPPVGVEHSPPTAQTQDAHETSTQAEHYSMCGKAIGFFLLLLYSFACAQTDISVLNFPKVPVTDLIILCCGLAFIIIVISFFEIQRRKRQLREEQRVTHSIFEINAQQRGLTDTEATRLYHLAESAQVPEINDVFEQVAVFERCIDKEITSFLSRGIRAQTRLEEEKILSEIRKKLKYNFLENDRPLVSTRNLTIGQNVSIFSKTSRQPLVSKARIFSNHEFYFSIQYDRSMAILVAPGDFIRIAFSRQNDGVYGIEVKVSIVVDGTIEAYHTLDLKRHQMRKDVRLEVNLPLRFRVIRPTDAAYTQTLGQQPFSGRISDISGGGISFLSDKQLKAGDILSLSFSAGDQTLMNGLKGRVLRISRQKSTNDLFRSHIQFSEIEDSQREKIIKYIFEKQHQINQWR